MQLDAAWQNEFHFDLLAIKFAFYVPQYLKQREKGWTKFIFQRFQRNISSQTASVWILSSFATEQRIALCRCQDHFHKGRHNAFKKTSFTVRPKYVLQYVPTFSYIRARPWIRRVCFSYLETLTTIPRRLVSLSPAGLSKNFGHHARTLSVVMGIKRGKYSLRIQTLWRKFYKNV